MACDVTFHFVYKTIFEKLKLWFVVNTDLTISTEKLMELFASVRDDKVDHIAHIYVGLPTPSSKRDDIRRNYRNPAQRRDAYLDLYATDHPCPSWSDVASALRYVGLRHQSDEVKRTYVQGTGDIEIHSLSVQSYCTCTCTRLLLW